MVLCALLLVAVVVIVGLKLSGGQGGGPTAGHGSGGSSAPKAATPVRIADVSDFDPQGDPPRENPDLAPLAADGQVGTSWHTSTYFD